MPEAACEHVTEPGWDHIRCIKCGAVRTGMAGWSIARQKWFASIEAARFYEKNGRLPGSV